MRLKKQQKEALLVWIGEGLETDEINDRAKVFDPPFTVTRPNVAKYRKTRAIALSELQAKGEQDALTHGLALKAERVRRLQLLAELLEKDLFGGFLWLDQVKSIGGGPFSEKIEYEEFNTAEVQQYRGILDDIAKELGDRKQIAEVTGKNGSPLVPVIHEVVVRKPSNEPVSDQ